MTRRRVTIRDVAKAANVSSSTVSNVLNNNDYHVSEETKQTVLAAIRKLGYKPSPKARSLRVQRLMSLAIVISQAKGPHILADPMTAEVMRGITDYAKELDCKIVLHITESWDPVHYELTFREQKIESAVVLGAQKADPLIDRLMTDDIPFVTVDHHGTNHANVGPDHHKAGQLLAKHLVAQGRKRFAIITPESPRFSSDRLLAGVLQTLFSAGIELPAKRVVASATTQDGGIQAARILLEADPNIDALLTGDDIVASGALRELKRQGVIVPDDCALYGYGNSPAGELTDPPLSTVDPCAYALGWHAVRWLSSHRQDEPLEPIDLRLPVELVHRGTG